MTVTWLTLQMQLVLHCQEDVLEPHLTLLMLPCSYRIKTFLSSQYNKPKFNDRYLADLANATCAVLSGGCSGAMFNPTYAAVFTFHQVTDKQGNVSVVSSVRKKKRLS